MSSRQVTLDGGSPWGFRMHGGADAQLPLRIARVNPGSKAALRGIREGDVISSINGRSTSGLSNAEAHQLLRSAQDTLTLGLNQGITGSPKRRSQKLAQENKEDNLKRTNVTSSSSSISNVSTITHTVSNSQLNNESTYTNGVIEHSTAERKTQESNSQSNYSSYVKNGSPFTTPHGATTTSDTVGSRDTSDGTGTLHTAEASVIVAASDKTLVAIIMADNVSGSSRSRKQRRSRSHRKKSKKTTVSETVETTTLSDTLNSQPSTSSISEVNDYKVEFPIQNTVNNNDKKSNSKTIEHSEHTDTLTTQLLEENTSSVEFPLTNTVNTNDKKANRKTIELISQPPEENTSSISEVNNYKVEFPVTTTTNANTNDKKSNSMVKSRSLDDDDHVKITEVTEEEKSSCLSESTAIVSEAESDVEWETVSEIEKQEKSQQFGKLSVISLPLEEHITNETSHISPEDERNLRDFLEGLNLVNSPEDSAKRIDKTVDSPKSKKAKKRAVLAQHFLPCYNQRYLDVISEEGSDLSDRDTKHSAFVCRVLEDCDDDDVFEDSEIEEQKLRNKFQCHFAKPSSSNGAVLVGTKLIENNDMEMAVMKEATWTTSTVESQSGAEVVYLEDSSNSMTPSDLVDLEDTVGDLDADDEEDISLDLDKTCSESLDIELSSESSLMKPDITVTSSSDTASRASLPTDSDQIKSETTAISTPPPTPHTLTNDTVKTIDFLQKLLSTLSNNDSTNILVTLNEEEAQHLPSHIKNKLKHYTESKDSVNKEEIVVELNTFRKSISRENSAEKDETCDTDSANKQSNRTSEEKCSENEEELNKELKTLCECLDAPKQTDKSCSGSRSGSASSQCTAVYNPLHSSLSNIAALLKENDEEPLPLRELCVRALLTMPFGKDVIEELANVSQSLEEMTCRTPSCSHPTLTAPLTPDIDVCILPAPVPTMDSERWVGLPTEENPAVLVCLSPKQKEVMDKTKAIPNEADSLLDLHRKFIERRGYHEDYDLITHKPLKDMPAYKVEFNNNKDSINTDYYNTGINYNNYVKQFTRDIPVQVLRSNDTIEKNTGNANIRYSTYIKQLVRQVPIEVENKINKPVNNKIYRDAMNETEQEPRILGDRLKARHLGEWLNLARNECDKINNFSEHATKVHNLHSSVNKLVSQRSCEERYSHVSNATFQRQTSPRRYSLPFNLYEQQMQYILEKEREIKQEIEKLKEEKSKLENESESFIKLKEFDAAKYQISRKGDIAILQSDSEKPSNKIPASSDSEKFREQMYNEYMCKVAERQERKQNKVIKLTEPHGQVTEGSQYEVLHVCGIEDEFMTKVRDRKSKLGITEDEAKDEGNNSTPEDSPPVKVLDGDELTDASRLPKHLQEFIHIANTDDDDGVWSPGKQAEEIPLPAPVPPPLPEKKEGDEPPPVVWTPRSAGSSPTAERKEFRPVSSPKLSRKNPPKESSGSVGVGGSPGPECSIPVPPPWQGGCAEPPEERRLTSSQSAPAAGLTSLSKLPRAPHPTITLLQKAREGQLPRGAAYIEEPQSPSQKPRIYTVKNEYLSESENEKPKKMADLGPRKFEGIGPTTKDGMPIVLRSEVKESNQAKWYKRMYDTLHRARNDDEYVTVRYKTRRGGRYPYAAPGGYLSEPEPNAYDSDASISASKYATLDRRRFQQNRDKENDYITYTVPRNKYVSASVRHSTDVYKNQPGRIEDYVPGHSSISEKEAKEWWDEVMDIFDGHLEQQKHVPPSKSFMSHALKESGYESDSTLVFRRREDAALQLSPHEQKEAYKTIQKGGEVPLHGLRKLAPERPKEPVGVTPPPRNLHDNRVDGSESPRKYVEDEVTIHYRSPVRHEVKEALSEEELARRQAEAMRRIYQEERRRKYLQELQDMNSRRHTDNFIPSQKSPIPLNRYDDFCDDLAVKVRARSRSPEPRLVARALYNFVGQSARELTFRKGDVIYIRRQVDKNWFEGEHNAMVGLFPTNYVEIVPYDGVKQTPRKAHEGQARAKFNFIAQTHLELSLAKGELVVLIRRVDDNWFEGRIGSRKGIFPVSYVEILIDPNDKPEGITSSKPVASPAAHSLLLNGSAGGKESMGSHHYQPSYTPQQVSSYHAKPINVIGTTTSYSVSRTHKLTPSVNEALHIDTQSEPVPYRALYKYRPQNDDELELQEGDTVFVLEKCDDGWYVGSSQRTGSFGTFPGNYVERI